MNDIGISGIDRGSNGHDPKTGLFLKGKQGPRVAEAALAALKGTGQLAELAQRCSPGRRRALTRK